jgi:hypothetical protein
MKILRSILAILTGLVVAFVAVAGAEQAGHAVYPPPEAMKDSDAFKKLLADPPALQQMMDEMPVGALVAVLLGWQAGAFCGGAAAAFLTAVRPCLHAAIIGVAILLGSVANMMMIPHPDWMKLAGLLLPIPASLLAGKFVSLLFPAPPAPQPQTPVDQA